MQLLITRPAEDAAALAPYLKMQGHRLLFLPMLTIIYDEAVPLPADCGGFAFTSANGARAFAACGGLWPGTLFAREKPIFNIGMHTEQAMRIIIGERIYNNIYTCLPPNNNMNALADLIIRHKDRIHKDEDGIVKPLVYVTGRHHSGDLVAQLQAADIEAEKYVLYEACPTTDFDPTIAAAIIEQSLQETSAQGALLYSRRSADLFLDYWQKYIAPHVSPDYAKHYSLFCLSPALADYMRQKGFASFAAAAPTRVAMLDLLAKEALNNQ